MRSVVGDERIDTTREFATQYIVDIVGGMLE